MTGQVLEIRGMTASQALYEFVGFSVSESCMLGLEKKISIENCINFHKNS